VAYSTGLIFDFTEEERVTGLSTVQVFFSCKRAAEIFKHVFFFVRSRPAATFRPDL
jgi:hypothetical protein